MPEGLCQRKGNRQNGNQSKTGKSHLAAFQNHQKKVALAYLLIQKSEPDDGGDRIIYDVSMKCRINEQTQKSKLLPLQPPLSYAKLYT